MTNKTERYHAQVCHLKVPELWYDLNENLYSQPVTDQGYARLFDDIQELVHSQDREYRIVLRTVTVTEKVM